MKVISWYATDDDHQAIRVRVAELGVTRQDWMTRVIRSALTEDTETQKQSLASLELPDEEQVDQAIDVLREVASFVEANREQVSATFIKKILAGTLTLADLNKTARALDLEPSDLQRIKKCENGEHKNVTDRVG